VHQLGDVHPVQRVQTRVRINRPYLPESSRPPDPVMNTAALMPQGTCARERPGVQAPLDHMSHGIIGYHARTMQAYPGACPLAATVVVGTTGHGNDGATCTAGTD
jgi:hypothetical protein